jgi:hypothetical protein
MSKQKPAKTQPEIGGMDQFQDNSSIGVQVANPEDAPESLTDFDLGINEEDKTDSPCPVAPPADGRQPKIGDWVMFWFEEGGKLQGNPMQLIRKLIDGTWNANVHKWGNIVRRTAVRFNPTPRVGCWTWQEE